MKSEYSREAKLNASCGLELSGTVFGPINKVGTSSLTEPTNTFSELFFQAQYEAEPGLEIKSSKEKGSAGIGFEDGVGLTATSTLLEHPEIGVITNGINKNIEMCLLTEKLYC